MKKTKKHQKVLVAMSGGADSSVVAALLKKTGFKVIGVFMILADLPRFQKGLRAAKKISQILEIPFYSLDLKKIFKKEIINSFLEKYKKGQTPNPCVVCNQKIKFGYLRKMVQKFGADFLATGHYAKIQLSKNYYKLLKAKDKKKDQSYFLWTLKQSQLKKIIFPLGNYSKEKVKKLAKKWNLPVLEKESQEICFIPKTLDQFLETKIKAKKGKILTLEGKIVGEHRGLPFYTIGQRKGIELPGGPFYVVNKNLKKNTLIVTPFFRDKSLYKKSLVAKNVNWVSGRKPKLPLKIKAQIRYGHKAVPAVINRRSKSKVYSLKFKVAQRAITPGQSVVFYQGQEVLGGGIIC